MVVRYDDETTKQVDDSFLNNILDVTEATSCALFEAIVSLINNLEIPTSNLLGFDADNCNVMMGKHNGLRALLKVLTVIYL